MPALAFWVPSTMTRVAVHVIHIRGFGEGEINLDRIDRRNRRQFAGSGTNEIADLRPRYAGDAVNGRGDFGKLEIQFRALDRGLRGRDCGLGHQAGMLRVNKLLLADGLFLCEGGVALDVEFGFVELGLGLGELAPGLIQCRLERARINVEQQISLFHLSPLPVILRHEIAGDLRANLGVHVTIEGADPLCIKRNIRRLDGHYINIRRRRCRGLFLGPTSC